jgi:DNA (cytosine-5)-methyltransferase 1
MRFLSVCSGIEAASVAWSPLGWKAFAFSEIEKFPCDLLAHYYPDVPNLGDMTKFEEWPIPDEPIDLLCGGTPCQSFSFAGLGEGLDDPRGQLMLTFARVAAKYRHRWLVWENVPGVLSSNAGRDFASFLGLITGQCVEPPSEGWSNSGILPGYRNAYGVAWRTLDAQYFGLAQRRKRVFVIGYLGDWRRAAAVLLERHSLQGHPAPRREARTIAAALTSNGVGTCGADDNQAQALHLIPQIVGQAMSAKWSKGTAGPAGDKHHNLMPVAYRTAGDGAAYEEGNTIAPLTTGTDPSAQIIAFSAKDHGADAMNDLAPTLRAGGHANSHANAGVMPAIAFQSKQSSTSKSPSFDGVSPTLDVAKAGGVAIALAANTIGRKPENGGNGASYTIETAYTLTKSDQHGVAQGVMVRRLTPRECERLQGFPDDYTAIPRGNKPASECADGPRYKALGNSWAIPCVRWIGERIAAVDAIPQPAATH